jgi:hypothetical protein
MFISLQKCSSVPFLFQCLENSHPALTLLVYFLYFEKKKLAYEITLLSLSVCVLLYVCPPLFTFE